MPNSGASDDEFMFPIRLTTVEVSLRLLITMNTKTPEGFRIPILPTAKHEVEGGRIALDKRLINKSLLDVVTFLMLKLYR